MYPKVSIVILNWNGKEDTLECLESISHIDYPNFEIILVDNGSTDCSVECFKEKYPEIEIVQNKENLGFAEGNNVGINKIITRGTDYILLQNNDTVVDSRFLTELVQEIEKDNKIGVVGPTVYYYDSPRKIQSAGAKIWWYIGRAQHLRKNRFDNGNLGKTKEVDYITGCSLLAKSELFSRVGYLNKNYFAYWEECDWCVRVKKADYKIFYVPSAKIWHKGGSTSSKISGFSEYHMTRNMFWFMKQNATKKQYALFILFFFGVQLWLSVIDYIIFHQNVSVILSFLKGIGDGLKGEVNSCP
jgi:GT2 family glycosyltransferase